MQVVYAINNKVIQKTSNKQKNSFLNLYGNYTKFRLAKGAMKRY